jgi:hypothetical protein
MEGWSVWRVKTQKTKKTQKISLYAHKRVYNYIRQDETTKPATNNKRRLITILIKTKNKN